MNETMLFNTNNETASRSVSRFRFYYDDDILNACGFIPKWENFK